MSEYSAYPLCWPLGQPRTSYHLREEGRFDGKPGEVRDQLLDEIDRMLNGKVTGYALKAIVSSNLPLRRDGTPLMTGGEPADPGVAVYFTRKGRDIVIACDRYDKTWKNMRAIQRTIEAMRAIERHGSREMMDRAFSGFEALPAPGEGSGSNAWKVLGLDPLSSSAEIEKAFRALAKQCHPDAGGSDESWHRLQTARRDALAQIS